MSCAEDNVQVFQKAKARELISRFETFRQECLPRPLHRKTNQQPKLAAAAVEDCFKRPHHESTNVFVHLRNRIEGPSKKRNSARRIHSRCQRYTLTLYLVYIYISLSLSLCLSLSRVSQLHFQDFPWG